MAAVSDIDFASARAKKKRLDDAISGSSPEQSKSPSPNSACPAVHPGSGVYTKFLDELNQNLEVQP